MIGLELKAIVVILMIVLIVYNYISYTPVDSKTFGYGAPSKKSIILILITQSLFMYGLYLNENPIILF